MEEREDIYDAMEMLGSGYDQIRVKDNSNDRRYFTITPRIVKAYARNAHDLALWETVKDVAGEEGECYLNTEQLAILSGISMGQVYSSRRYWMKIGFLTGELKKDPGYAQKVWHLSVPDLWAKNIEWCEKYPKIADRITFRKAHKSFHTVKASKELSPSERKLSPSETKNILIKKILDDDESRRRELELAISARTEMLKKLYEGNVGPITPLLMQFLGNAAIDYPDQEWYQPAFEVMVTSATHRNWNFVDMVLRGWKEHYFGWKPDFNKQSKGVKHGAKRSSNVSAGKPEGLSPDEQRTADAINRRRAAKKATMSAMR